MGKMDVDVSCYWGVQIECSIYNFLIGCDIFVWGCFVIWVLGILKKGVVQVNVEFGELFVDVVDFIVKVVDEVIVGKFDEYFLLVVFQIGLGIQSNMNVNEVIFNCVIEFVGGEMGSKKLVYFNDYVNRGQSFNDIFFIVMYIVVVLEFNEWLYGVVGKLCDILYVKVEQYKDFVKVGCIYL